MGFRKAASALVLGSAGLVSTVARADPSPLDPNVVSDYGETPTPRAAAMGGALRALGTGTTGIYLNPAALASAQVYHIEAGVFGTPETRRVVLGAAIVDSITSRLAGSFSIQGTPVPMDPDGIKRNTLDLRLGLGFPITERFLIGLTGRYVKDSQSGTAAPNYGFCFSAPSGGLIDTTSGTIVRQNTACNPNQAGAQDRNAFVNTATLDAGLLIKPVDSLGIAFVGQNLTYQNNGLLPMIVGGGIGYGADVFAIEVDGIADFSSWGIPGAAKPTARIMGGAEYKLGGVVPLRAGFKYDQGAKLGTVGFGSGYVGNEFALEASVTRTASNPGATTIYFAASYYLESTGLARATTSVPAPGSVQ